MPRAFIQTPSWLISPAMRQMGRRQAACSGGDATLGGESIASDPATVVRLSDEESGRQYEALDDVDVLIQRLLNAGESQLPSIVYNSLSLVNSKQFEYRFKNMIERAPDSEEKRRLSALLVRVYKLEEEIVAEGRDKLTAAESQAQDLLQIATNEKGEFYYPLPWEVKERVRTFMRDPANLQQIDDGQLFSIQRWYEKGQADERAFHILPTLELILESWASQTVLNEIENDKRLNPSSWMATSAAGQVLQKLFQTERQWWCEELESDLMPRGPEGETKCSVETVRETLEEVMKDIALRQNMGSRKQTILVDYFRSVGKCLRDVEDKHEQVVKEHLAEETESFTRLPPQ